MAAAGVRLVQRVERVTVVGGTEALRPAPRALVGVPALRRQLRYRRPRVLVLIDFPEFNMRLARVARRLGVPVVYFVAPQLWAWRPRAGPRHGARRESRPGDLPVRGRPLPGGRGARGVRRPSGARRPARVGPRCGALGARGGRRDARGPPPGQPGRRGATAPARAARGGAAHRARRPRTRFALPVAGTIPPAGVAEAVRASGLPVEVLPGEAYRVMAAADLLLVASGHRHARGRLLRRADGRAVPTLRAVARASPAGSCAGCRTSAFRTSLRAARSSAS